MHRIDIIHHFWRSPAAVCRLLIIAWAAKVKLLPPSFSEPRFYFLNHAQHFARTARGGDRRHSSRLCKQALLRHDRWCVAACSARAGLRRGWRQPVSVARRRAPFAQNNDAIMLHHLKLPFTYQPWQRSQRAARFGSWNHHNQRGAMPAVEENNRSAIYRQNPGG